MKRRARLALPTLLVLFWTLVVAPFAVARCDHGDGDIHLHALGAACADDGDAGAGDRSDCRAVKADPADVGHGLAEAPPAPSAPAPHPALILVFPDVHETARNPFSQAPPVARPRLRPGEGRSPLLI